MVKRYIKSKLSVVFIALGIILSIFPTNFSVLANGNLDITVEYGIDGKFKSTRDIPIIVKIKNNGTDFQGEVQVDIPIESGRKHNTYSKEVSIASGSEKTVILPIKLAEEQRKVKVNIVDNKGNITEKSVLLDNGRVNESNLLVGMVTDDINPLSYFSTITYSSDSYVDPYNKQQGVNGTLVPVTIAGNNIGDNPKNITALDVIIINNYDTSKFASEQISTLKMWVESGGTLILGTGVNGGKTLSGFSNGYIDGVSNKSISKEVSILNENLTLDLVEVNKGTVLVKSGADNVITLQEMGRGKVIVASYDLGIEPMSSFAGNSQMWNSVFSQVLKNRYGNEGYVPWELQNMLSAIGGRELPSVWVITSIFLIYIVIVGIIVYFILKRINKRDMIWIVAPVVSIVFGLVLYLFGSNSRLNDYIVNKVNIVEIDEAGNGVVSPYVGISSSNNKDLSIEEPEDLHLDYLNFNNYYYGSDNFDGKSKQELKTIYKGNKTYFEFADNPLLKNRNFQVSNFEQKFNELESDLYFEDGKLMGSVKNTIGTDIKKAMVVVGNSVWDLGNLKDGEEITLDGSLNSIRGLDNASYKLQDQYYKAKYQDNNLEERKEELKDFSRTADMLRLVSGINYGGIKGSKLIAITDLPVNYALELNSKSISEFNTTALLVDLDLNFVNSSGQTEYPLGYFETWIENESGSGYIEYPNFFIYNDVEAIVNYDIATTINIEEITFNNKIPSDYRGNNKPFKGKMFLYNVNTKNYEEIDMVGEKEYKLSNNVYDYIEDGNLKIKIIGNKDEGAPVPQISVKGRAQ